MEVAIETMADVAGDVVALVTGFISYELIEEVAEGMIDVIPRYGLCVGVLRLVWGLVYAVTRMASWRQARRSEPWALTCIGSGYARSCEGHMKRRWTRP